MMIRDHWNLNRIESWTFSRSNRLSIRKGDSPARNNVNIYASRFESKEEAKISRNEKEKWKILLRGECVERIERNFLRSKTESVWKIY